jgi:CopG antitoxin of type II toxin-antitoxin system
LNGGKAFLTLFLKILSNETHSLIEQMEKRGAAYAHEGQKNEGLRPKSHMAMKPRKKRNQKPKLNVTLSEDAKQKLAALAELEKRSVSNLIEVMADERWEELAEREGVDYAKTVAEIAGLKGLSADKESDRKVFRREILKRVLKFKKK